MKSASRHGFVYFIKPCGQSGPIKIGFSIQMQQRIGALSAASPLLLELIGSTPGSLEDERFLHRCFAEQYSHGEWFHANAALHSAIESILQKGIQFARETLTERGLDRLSQRRPRSDQTKARMSVSLRKSWVARRERISRVRS